MKQTHSLWKGGDDCMAHLYGYPIFFNLTIESGKSDFEQSGSFCLVAVSMVKNLDDVVALHALEVEAVVTL